MQLKTTITKKEFIEKLNTSILLENDSLIDDITNYIENNTFNNKIEIMQYILKRLDFFNFVSIDSIPMLIVETFNHSNLRIQIINKNHYEKYKHNYNKTVIDYDYNNKVINNANNCTILDLFWESFETKNENVGFNFKYSTNLNVIASENNIENLYNNITSYQFYTICYLFYNIMIRYTNIAYDYNYYILVYDYALFNNYKKDNEKKIKFVENALFNNNLKNDFLYSYDDKYIYKNIELNINANNTVITLDSIINNNINFDDVIITMENKE